MINKLRMGVIVSWFVALASLFFCVLWLPVVPSKEELHMCASHAFDPLMPYTDMAFYSPLLNWATIISALALLALGLASIVILALHRTLYLEVAEEAKRQYPKILGAFIASLLAMALANISILGISFLQTGQAIGTKNAMLIVQAHICLDNIYEHAGEFDDMYDFDEFDEIGNYDEFDDY